ncbi:MAG: hypothetical protein AB7S26_01180 [Sandaracinaceae bacterium]
MANKFLRALAKVKLIEIDGDEAEEITKSSTADLDLAEVDRVLAEEEAREKARGTPVMQKTPAAPARQAARPVPATAQMPATQVPVSAPTATPPAGGTGDIVEGRPFEEIYAMSSVPGAPYAAEKLLKVLDGLRAMDPHTRTAAVLAMDAADDAWSIADVVLDAQRKVRALNESVQGLSAQLQQLAQHSQQEKQRRDEYLQKASDTIRQKIAELEATLAQENADVARQKAEIDARLQNAQAACAREVTRLSGEVARLQEIPQAFAVGRQG